MAVLTGVALPEPMGLDVGLFIGTDQWLQTCSARRDAMCQSETAACMMSCPLYDHVRVCRSTAARLSPGAPALRAYWSQTVRHPAVGDDPASCIPIHIHGDDAPMARRNKRKSVTCISIRCPLVRGQTADVLLPLFIFGKSALKDGQLTNVLEYVRRRAHPCWPLTRDTCVCV